MNLDLLTVGDVMVDIIIDLHASIQGIPRGGTFPVKDAKISFGGVGNVAVASSHLGIKAAVLGMVGTNLLGDLYLKDLREYDVRSLCFKSEKKPTGFVISLLDEEKERTFLIYRGANDLLTPEHVRSKRTYLASTKLVYLTGYSLAYDPQRTAIKEVTQLTEELNCKMAFDPSSYVVIQQQRRLVETIAQKSDILLLNSIEAKTLSNSKTYEATIKCLKNRFSPTIIIKEGKQGCTLLSRDEKKTVSGFTSSVVDSTGAGDAFNAGLLSCLLKGDSLRASCEFGNWFASKVIERYGARTFPSKREIDDFLTELES